MKGGLAFEECTVIVIVIVRMIVRMIVRYGEDLICDSLRFRTSKGAEISGQTTFARAGLHSMSRRTELTCSVLTVFLNSVLGQQW